MIENIPHTPEGFEPDDHRHYWKVAVFIIVTLLAIVLAAISGCKTTKEMEKTVTVVDSSYAKKYDSLSKRSSTTIASLQKQLSDAKKTQVKFKEVPCPPIPKLDSSFCNKDSLIAAYNRLAEYTNSLKNKVTVLANGSIQYEGQITKFKSDFSSLESMNYEYQQRLNDSTKVSDSLRAELQKKDSSLTKSIKRGWPWWIWMMIGSGITLIVLYRNKILLTIKKLFV